MFKVGQRYRVLKPFYTGVREYDEVGTCIEILGVDGVEAWFHEYEDCQKDWLFPLDLKMGGIELVEKEDILKQKLREYNLKNTNGTKDVMYSNDNYIVGLENGFVDILRRSQESDRYIKFPESDLEQLIVALTSVLEDE